MGGDNVFIPYRDRIRAAADRHGDKVAIQDDHGALSYRALAAGIEAFGAFLDVRGVGQGDCIAICAFNSLDYGFVYVAAAANGIVVAPLPQSATAANLCAMVVDCDARIIFCDAENEARLRAAGCATAIEPLQALSTPVANGAEARTPPDISPDGIFNIIYSSGTTGTPKGIVQANAMRDAHVELARACGYDENSITLVSTPLYSNTTLVSFLPTLALGGTAVIMARFDVEGFLERSQAHRATHAMLVPVQYQRLLAHDRFGDFDLSAYREKFCTSAPFAADLKREVLGRWPGGLTEYYGMTEGGGLCILAAHRHPDKLHTVGQPAPENDMRIIDEEGRELPRGSTGEVVGRSRGMMRGYHNLPEATAAALWRSPDGQSFMRSGDTGRFDEDGFLILMDRKKDVIISGGFNIYPSDLEEVVRLHPMVEDVAVVGVASEQWGETPIAFVVAPRESPDAIRHFANERLGKSQRIAAVCLVESLPRNAIGKILKRDLRDGYQQRAAKDADPV